MDVPLHVQVDTVLDHQLFKRLLTGQADVRRRILHTDVPRALETDDNPRRVIAVDGGEIIFKPLILLVRVSKRTAVCARIRATDFVWRLETDREVCFTIEYNEVGKAIVKGIPEIADATGFVGQHVEVVDLWDRKELIHRQRNDDNWTHCIQ